MAEAVAVLPEVEQLVRRLRSLRDEVLAAKGRLDGCWERLGRGEPVLDDLLAAQRDVEHRALRAAEAASRLEEIGCVLRDLDLGLIDFPARAGEREVFLCWRLGEDTVRFWHGADEGYAGRKPLSELPRGRGH
ncbi:MAG: DUF2203 domain-containing protein [Armatimonadota bacterium]|nr:DUF2203 domain-containing protein [Armatimonadota bacterium]